MSPRGSIQGKWKPLQIGREEPAAATATAHLSGFRKTKLLQTIRKKLIFPLEDALGIASHVHRIRIDAGGDGVGPFAIFQTFEHLGTPQLQAVIAGEGDALANRVVELDGRHTAADGRARVRARLHTLGQSS